MHAILSSEPPTVSTFSPDFVNSDKMNSELPSLWVRRGRKDLRLPHSLPGIMAPPHKLLLFPGFALPQAGLGGQKGSGFITTANSECHWKG